MIAQPMRLLVVCWVFVAGAQTANAFEGRIQHVRADGPLRNYAPEAIAEAVKLRDALAGTIWSYHFQDRKYDIGFATAGDVQLLRSWRDVRWRVAGPREVLLETTSGEYMVLRFDNRFTHFWTKDWDGRKAEGWQTDQRLPGEHPTSLNRKAQAASRQLAPPRVDLRPEFQRRQLGVRQQAQRGACQVFAFVGVLEYQLSRPDAPVDLSEQFLMWAANEANRMKRTEGFNPDLLSSGLKKHGICRESLMPYVPRNEPIDKPSEQAVRDGRALAGSSVKSVKHWTSATGFSDQQIQTIRGHLDAGTPVTATFCWPEGQSSTQIVDANDVLVDRAVDGKSKDGHGVILCGYGLDERSPAGGYFIFRNSWGPEFADQGYARLTFDYARQYGIDAYIPSVAWGVLAIPTPPVTAGEKDDFFRKRVQPLLADRCWECHRERAEGGLRLDSRAGMLKGGESGPAIRPGDAKRSLLIRVISGQHDEIMMPPNGDLPKKQIEILRRWVTDGAVWPDAK